MRGGFVGGLAFAALGAGLGLVLHVSPAHATVRQQSARKSSFYCLKTHTDLRIYAGRIEPNGDLKFGLSLWEGAQNIRLFGVARRHGRGWEYTDKLNAAEAVDRCRLDITLDASGAPRLAADPKASCQGSRGGYGAEIGTVQFSERAYRGPVTIELDNSDAFLEARRC